MILFLCALGELLNYKVVFTYTHSSKMNTKHMSICTNWQGVNDFFVILFG
jgi:hypothetical protein